MTVEVSIFVISFDHDGSPVPSVQAARKVVSRARWSQAVRAVEDDRWIAYKSQQRPTIGVGEAGCWLAHFKVWEEIAALNISPDSPTIVLESDVLLSAYGVKNLARCLSIFESRRLHLLHLGQGYVGQFDVPASGGRIRSSLGRIRGLLLTLLPPILKEGFCWGTYAYAISPRAASELVSYGPDFSEPVDAWLRRRTLDYPGKFGCVRQASFVWNGRPSEVSKIGR